jgi:phosphoribosyl 1,2-cyclic phosphodiesterase
MALELSGLSFASLGSGSKGNGTLVCKANTRLLLDCGFSLKETVTRMQRLGVAPDSLTAIFVTHEHGDHIGGVGVLAREYGLPVYLTAGTWRAASHLGELPHVELIPANGSVQVGDITVTPVAVPHDASEPVQYVFQSDGKSVGVLTDLGSVTEAVLRHYAQCDALLLEANHCPDLLASSAYPLSVKQRIGSDWGHLSNVQAKSFLIALSRRLKYLVLVHLSEQNNSPDRVLQVLGSQVQIAEEVFFACQQRGFDWLSVG